MRLLILDGAPRCEDLDFSPASLLDADVAAELFTTQLGVGELNNKTTHPDVGTAAKWRRLGPKGERLRTGWSQPYLPASAPQNFSFSIPNLEGVTDFQYDDTSHMNTAPGGGQNSLLYEFIEHSLAFHDKLQSSQIVADDATDRTVSSSSFLGDSFFLDSTSFESTSSRDQRPIVKVPATLTLTSLAELPSASHLRSIVPQTPTVNLLCVVTSPLESKEVLVKRGTFKMTIQELTVADDSKSGFKVSFWKRPLSKDKSQNILADTLAQVNVGDVILLRNVALTQFRDSVYGQSLNPSIARARTTVEIVANENGISNRQMRALPEALVPIVAKLRKWAKVHVAPDAAQPSRKKRKFRNDPSSPHQPYTQDEMLPPDTMQSV